MMEARISELTDLVGRAQVVDPSTLPHQRISFGSTVTLVDVETDDVLVYTIVGGQESNPDKGLISFQSPLAKQLLGKQEGDEVRLNLPSGKKHYEIEAVEYREIEIS